MLVGAYTGAGIGSASASVPDVRPGDVIVEVVGNAYGGAAGPTMSGAGAGSRSEIGAKLGSPNANQYRNAQLSTWRRECAEAGTFVSTATWSEETMIVALLLRFAGALDGSPSGAATAQSSSHPAAVQAPTVTTATDGPLLIGCWAGVQFSGTLTWAPQASMTERAEVATNQYVSTMVATEARAAGATGATGARSATASPPPQYGSAARLIAVRGVAAPAAVGPEPGRGMLAC